MYEIYLGDIGSEGRKERNFQAKLYVRNSLKNYGHFLFKKEKQIGRRYILIFNSTILVIVP